MTITLIGVAATLAVAGASCTLAQDVRQSPRRHAVGFRADSMVGRTGPSGRVLLWYPAERTTTAPMRLADYVRADRADVAEPTVAIGELLRGYGVDSAGVARADRLAGSRTAAHAMEAPARPPRTAFPLVLLGNGLASPGWVNAALAESLAARGYVVASLASPRRSLTFSVADVESIAVAMRQAVRVAARTTRADSVRIALVGWSVGAVAEALLQMRDANVRAFVSLDGGIGYAYARAMLDSSTWTAPDAATVPLLHLTGAAPVRSAVAKDSYYADSISRGASFLATFSPLTHADFTAFGVGARVIAGDTAATAITAAYARAVSLVGSFLDAVFAADATVAERLNAWQAAARDSTFTLVVRRAAR